MINSMRRVLFIAYLYPPIVNSGTRRSLSFVNHLPDYGWTPVVLTLNDPDPRDVDPRLLDEVRIGTRVERAALRSRELACYISSILPSSWRKNAQDALAWRFKRFWFTPDEAAAWVGPAVRLGCRLHAEAGFDVIYASGWPWSSFRVAHEISKRTGCPFVLDYRDPWRPSGTAAWEVESRLQSWFNPSLERRFAKTAAAIVSVTPTFVDKIKLDAGCSDIQCITNGFEPSDFDGIPISAGQALPHIVFTGVWRPGYGPELLYSVLRGLKAAGRLNAARIRVSAAGFEPGPASDYGISDIVSECGRVGHSEALCLMRSADLLFLPVSEGFFAKASLPGKLFEYLGSGQPILAIAPMDSEVARVLADTGGAIRLDMDDKAGLEEVLVAFATHGPLPGMMPLKPNRLSRYTRAATAEQLAGVLHNAAKKLTRPPAS